MSAAKAALLKTAKRNEILTPGFFKITAPVKNTHG
jgi:hypothetical protein